MERWSGKVAVVTGASSGIGAAIAESLVQNGMKVVGLARRLDRLQEIEKKLEGQKGQFFPLQTDLKIEGDITNAFKWVETNLGGVHVLVNNAGISKLKKLEDQDPEDWRDIYDVNVIAFQICSQLTLKSMKSHNINDGHIINISSVIAHMSSTLYGLATYAASKKVMNTISEGLRTELGAENSDIRVTTISPGLVDTEILELSGVKFPREVLDIALKSSDIAETVIFVLQLPPHVLVSEMVVQTTKNIRKVAEEATKHNQK